MKQTILLFISFLFFLGCHSTTSKPSNLLPQDKMVEILADVYLHQQQTYLVETKEENLDFSELDAQIIQKHGSNVKDFKASFQYYVLHPEVYSEILLSVRDKLEEKLPEDQRLKRIEERETQTKEIPKY